MKRIVTITVPLLLAGVACSGGSTAVTEGLLTADQFVAAYVDLRVSALSEPGGEITPEEKERILSEHRISEEDLLRFAEAHGGDAIFMRGVWDSVEVAYQRIRTAENEEDEDAEENDEAAP